MESLQKSLAALPKALAALPMGVKIVLVAGAVAAIAVGAWSTISSAEQYQYAFTNLTPEDSAEAAGALKTAGVPFRLEAGGSALAVPASKVYDARLLLAGAGLPRGGGVGFEIFDRGDLGVSEFTQQVNLRRATEGELARTISRLAQVRSARVHLTLPEKGLYRDQDRHPSAAVVVNLQPGRALGDREIAGIRHLVSSAVPELAPEGVTVVDGRGEVLTAEGSWGEAMGFQRRLEHDLESRVVDLLESAVGAGGVIARVTASVDSSEVQTNAETVDPEATALRSERRTSQESTAAAGGPAGVAGAAANQPLSPAAPVAGSRGGGTSTSEDQIRNFDVSRTTTTTVARVPRLQKLSVAVLVDAGPKGQARSDAELARLSELAKKAVGFDAERGDTFELTSTKFTHSDEGSGDAGAAPAARTPVLVWIAAGVALLVIGLLVSLLARRRRAPHAIDLPLLTPGARVAEIEAALARDAERLPPADEHPALVAPATAARERAREMATKDPTRTAAIMKAWIAQEAANAPSAPARSERRG